MDIKAAVFWSDPGLPKKFLPNNLPGVIVVPFSFPANPIQIDQMVLNERIATKNSGNYIQYELHGWIGEKEGMYQIGVEGGNLITHRFFKKFLK